MIYWGFRILAGLLAVLVLKKQIGELRDANGTRNTKKAMTFLNLLAMLALAIAPALQFGLIDLEMAMDINSATIFFLILQLFIIYYGKR